MKKYFLAIGLVAFLMTSCCEKQENAENKECCKDKKEQCDKQNSRETICSLDILLFLFGTSLLFHVQF